MKTSKQILLTVAGLVIIFFLAAVILLRNGVQLLRQNDRIANRYREISVNEFERLDISSCWIVKIRQGKECHIETTADQDSPLNPTIENINGTLFFSVDTASAKTNTDSLFVRITMPILRSVKASKGADINITDFMGDSLLVTLEDGCTFSGINYNIKYVTFKTSGENTLNITKIF
ncbi:MAG: DUF2807 domain-containing protein [Bacteroidales bacterium]|nr:DUF2807 domain-containing protein [Bacteroidales bacterium]